MKFLHASELRQKILSTKLPIEFYICSKKKNSGFIDPFTLSVRS